MNSTVDSELLTRMVIVAIGCLALSIASLIAYDEARNSPNYSMHLAKKLLWFEKMMRAGFFGTVIVLMGCLLLR